jgi:hypothetical protein
MNSCHQCTPQRNAGYTILYTEMSLKVADMLGEQPVDAAHGGTSSHVMSLPDDVSPHVEKIGTIPARSGAVIVSK